MQNKGLIMNECKPNCFEKTEACGAFFIFHQITDELSTKHETRLRTTPVFTKHQFVIGNETTICV